MSFIVGGVRKAKSRQANIFHPINIIDIVAYRNSDKLSRIKEAQYSVNYNSINRNVIKSSIAMFVVDLARNAIKEREANPDLYAFMKEELLSLDKTETGLRLYPQVFAIRLSRLLGFEPLDNFNSDNIYFDMLEGAFTDNDVRHSHILNEDQSRVFHRLLSDRQTEGIDKTQRTLLLDNLMSYYGLHLEGFRSLKCLPVLRSILS